jgi:hypothetical protein
LGWRKRGVFWNIPNVCDFLCNNVANSGVPVCWRLWKRRLVCVYVLEKKMTFQGTS